MPFTTWFRSMRIRVGQIPYLNSQVFYYGMADSLLELVPLTPRALSEAAIEGRIDVGPVPLVTSFGLEDRFTSLGSYCVATGERACSILLFSKRPIEELGGAVVGITGETSTSVCLLKTLLTQRFHVQPYSYVSLDQAADALLLIGDEALRNQKGVPSYPHRYDLGEEWYRWTGLPFVFARWLVRRDLERQAVDHLRELLEGCLDRGFSQLDRIAGARQDLGMSPAEIIEYIRNFRYLLGPEEMKAIKLFRELVTASQSTI